MIDVTKEFNLLMPEILCVSWAFILLLIAFFKGKNQINHYDFKYDDRFGCKFWCASIF